VYSALKQRGVPLYRRARRGEVVTVPPREVEMHRLELVAREGEDRRLHDECGSGTYVRSLVRDLGERLGCGAHVTALRRLWVEPFRHPAMTGLEELAQLAGQGTDALDARLLPLEAGLAGYPQVRLDAAAAQRLRQGRVVELADPPAAGRCVALGPEGRAVALAECAGTTLRALRGINPPAVPA
jgi:tRNA pseudouridine55 synthase